MGIWEGAAFGLVLSGGLSPVVTSLLRRRGVLDRPNERSLHSVPTPRGGGIGPALAGLVALALSSAIFGNVRMGLILGAAGFALVGLVEDAVGIAPGPRLAAQLLAAALASLWLVPDVAGQWGLLSLAVLWIVSYSNAFNFMDGMNGISVAQAIVAGASWAVVGWVEQAPAVSAAGLIAAAVALGFAPFNFPKARVFLGDVGSLFFGALLAGIVVLGIRLGVPPEAMIAPLALYLADTSTTLIRRARRRENLMSPHREHTYQRLAELGISHVRVVFLVSLVMAVCGGLGMASLQGSSLVTGAALALMGALLLGYLSLPHLLGKRAAGVP